MNTTGGSPGVLYVVVCAAPAASGVGELVSLARDAGWVVRVIATPMGERFIDADQLAELAGDRVRTGFRMPDEPDELPKADAVVVAPATFNTVNKWAAGITDTFAAGLLCELTGAGVPILVVPLLKDELARHVAFGRSLDVLRGMGVRVLFDPKAPPQSRMPTWPRVLEELQTVIGESKAGRAEPWILRNEGSGSRGPGAGVASPRQPSPDWLAGRKAGCPRSSAVCAR